MTERVDVKLIDKLFTIVNQISELLEDHPLEFKQILEIVKRLKIRK